MTSSDTSIRTEFQAEAEVLSEIQRWAAAERVVFMVVGALARNLLIRQAGARLPRRQTTDIDVAVAVDSWEDLDRLTKHFDSPDAQPHRFRVFTTLVDVVPFDGVESADRAIIWPNDHRMSVFGFREAFASAVELDLGVVIIRVASLAAQVVLKLEAWRDRHSTDRKDALDILDLLQTTGVDPYLEETYSHEDLMVVYEYDTDLAGAHRLGTEARELFTSRAAVEHILDLLNDQASAEGLLPAHMGADAERNRQLLVAFRDGLRA